MTLEIFSYGFMQRALVSGIAIALLCSVVGLFLVLRRYSLFGDAVAHSSFGGIAAGLLIVILLLYRELIYSTFNEEQAKVSGIPVEKMNYLIVFIAGITVVTSIQLVGILLISALFVIPNVTAIMYGRSFKQTALLSIAFAVSSVIVGILIS